MDFIGTVLGTPLGYIMKFCYDLIKDYGLAIIVFTLLTKVILFPVSLMVQKDSIKMIKMKPKLDAFKYQYVDDKDALFEAQNALYKEEKYNPFASVIPLLIQVPIILGLIDVVYRPMKHLLHFPQATIDAFVAKTGQIMGTTDLGSSPELVVMKCVGDPNNHRAFLSLQNGVLKGSNVAGLLARMQSVHMKFLGFDLSATPSVTHLNLLFLVPILAGLSALIMCIIQNKINVLQLEQGAFEKWGMTVFMIAFSSYFAFLVPAGVGFYWIFGNLFSIPVMYLVNIIYSPRKYIDYNTLNQIKEKAKKDRALQKENNKLSSKYYKELCRGGNFKKMKLMFYSEQSGFYKYFENIIEALLQKTDEPIYYITSDPHDQIFQNTNPQIKPYYISGRQLITLMMKLECDVVVMTTPDLEKYHIKRSKVRNDVEYIFLDHSSMSLNLTYRTGAFDYYDTIFAVSRNQGIEIREMEKLRGSKKKRIVKVGFGLIDNMIASYSKLEQKPHEKPIILIAPSWQYDNILDSCIDNILEGLVGSKYKVIVRPHPQYIRRFPVEMGRLMDKYRGRFSDDFEIQTDFSSSATVYTSDLLITDWSAIAYEFSFTTEKPTLFINTQMKVVNKDYDQIKLQPMDITARDIVGESISKDETKNIAEHVADMLAKKNDYAEQIRSLRDSYFYNLGHSGEVAADYIVERLANVSPSDANDD